MTSFPVSTIGMLGLSPDQQLVRVMNRTAAAATVGNLVMFDLHQTDAASTTFTTGATTSGLANVIVPATEGLLYGWFGIVTQGGADNAEIEVCVRGKVQALVTGTNLADEEADWLSGINAQSTIDTDVASGGEKILGVPLEATAGATAESIWILFNGIEGFGSGAES